VLFCIAYCFRVGALEEISNWFPNCLFGTVPFLLSEEFQFAVPLAVIQDFLDVPFIGGGFGVRYGSLMMIQGFVVTIEHISYVWLNETGWRSDGSIFRDLNFIRIPAYAMQNYSGSQPSRVEFVTGPFRSTLPELLPA